MNYNIGGIVNGYAPSISNVDFCPSSINRFETVNNKSLEQFYHHVMLENNPERPILDYSVAQSTRFGISKVMITRISYHIEVTVTASNGVSAKTNATFSKALTVAMPVGVTTPAVIYGIACSTGGRPQFSPLSAVPGAPVKSINRCSLGYHMI